MQWFGQQQETSTVGLLTKRKKKPPTGTFTIGCPTQQSCSRNRTRKSRNTTRKTSELEENSKLLFVYRECQAPDVYQNVLNEDDQRKHMMALKFDWCHKYWSTSLFGNKNAYVLKSFFILEGT